MSSIIEQKANLRKEMLSQRAHLNRSEKTEADQRLCAFLLERIKERNSHIVHAYIPMGTEINITPVLEQLLKDGIRVVCPKALPKGVLENRILYSLDELESGVMGTKHPAKQDIYDGPFDFIIVPGLAFDNQNYRLGYGGGYYDKFLTSQHSAFKQGIFYPFQEVAEVPREPHDCRLDEVRVAK